MKKVKNIVTTLIILFTIVSSAQVGIGTTTPNGALDISSTNDGLLIPRVALVNTTTVTVLTGTASELVYNTATSGDVTPGFYYLSTATGPWIRLATGGSGWQTNGNTNIVNNVNFMGTAAGNNVDVAFRRNNVAAGRIAATSTSYGVGALSAVAGVASNSVAFGNNALLLNTAANNVAVGNATLSSNVNGIQNTGIGNSALTTNTGSANSALGFEALFLNSTGNNNTGLGFQALRGNTTASGNTAVGFQASAMTNIGSSNTSMGFQAHQMNTVGSQNVAIGERSLGRNSGSGNTVVGWEAMFGEASSSNNSTAIGWHALFFNSGSDNTAVGYNALQGNRSATGNTAVGASSLNNNMAGLNNTAVGRFAGFAATASNGTFVGYNAGGYTTGSNNTAIGFNALDAGGSSANNVAIGFEALTNTAGSGNVALGFQAGVAEAGSNKLYITNSNTTPTTSLIYGEFAPTRILRTNSQFQIGDPLGTGYQFPLARGTINQVLQTNATGVLSWVNPSALTITELDPQVSSATINTIPKWDGTTLVDGIITDNGTSVAVAGNTTTTTFQMTNGANANYILQSDAAGNGSWVQNPLNTLSLVRVNLGGSNQVLTAPAPPGTWEKINFSTEVFDTSAEFAGGTFTATKDGFYQINAGFHTNDQSNTEQYAIGVFVNGLLYQETSGNHTNVGEVTRNINCLVNLAIGNTVEIFVKNFIAGVEINGFIGKTFFEVQQIR